MYDEVAVVVGKDVARGSGTESFDDVEIQSHRNTANLEEKGDGDSEFMKDNDKQLTSSVPLESRKSQKRRRDDDLKLQNISAQVAEVALALQKISKSKLDVDLLYQEVMRTEGFEEEFLGSAFDFLMERENLAKGFLAKNELEGFGLTNSRRTIKWSDISHPSHPLAPLFSFSIIMTL